MSNLLPLIVLGGAAALLLGASRKKSVSSGESGGSTEVPEDGGGGILPTVPAVDLGNPFASVPGPGPGPSTGVPGTPCSVPSPALAVYDENGECSVFYNGTSDESLLRELIVGVWQAQGPADLCNQPATVLVGEGVNERWETNPNIVDIAAIALADMYDQPLSAFPPQENSPYSIRSLWRVAVALVEEEICGRSAIT